MTEASAGLVLLALLAFWGLADASVERILGLLEGVEVCAGHEGLAFLGRGL